MTLTRPRKARILERAGLRYVAGWLPEADAADFKVKVDNASSLVKAALPANGPAARPFTPTA